MERGEIVHDHHVAGRKPVARSAANALGGLAHLQVSRHPANFKPLRDQVARALSASPA